MDKFPDLPQRQYILTFPPQRKYIAEALASSSPDKFYLNPVKYGFFDGSVDNGNPDFVIPCLHKYTHRHAVYICDWSTPAGRYYDMCCLIPIAELGPASLTIVLPFVPTGTMEREVFEGSIATANIDAKLLSSLPIHSHIITLDLHTMQNQFFFHDCTPSLLSTMPFARKLLMKGDDTSFVVAFPDDGAHKRFKTYFDGCEVAICAKVRDGNQRRVQLNDGDVDGKNVLIVDDLVRSGGTLIECAKVMKAGGAKQIVIFCPHACFPKGEFVRFIDGAGKDLIEKFYITDSVVSTVEKIRALNQDKFTVIPLADVLGTFL